MELSVEQRRRDAFAIWGAGVKAVDAAKLVRDQIVADAVGLTICGERWEPPQVTSRICVVGGGKAGAGMVVGLCEALGEPWLERTSGWLNVPEADFTHLAPGNIQLHPARPVGVNEPTATAVDGVEEILSRVGELTAEDLCIVLISGGGSALLPAPVAGISLEDKIAVTKLLSSAGATINDLNLVRRALSRVKGGGLLRACRAGRLIALIISDVIHDPLDIIASGPTVDVTTDRQQAWHILRSAAENSLQRTNESSIIGDLIPEAVAEVLQQPCEAAPAVTCSYQNHLIGNNETAVQQAVVAAEQLGYQVELVEAHQGGIARDFGQDWAERCLQLRSQLQPGQRVALISGGEPVVHLAATDQPRSGGRNQELALSAIQRLWSEPVAGITILSGGTDGEDGPTDAAGGICDEQVIAAGQRLQLNPEDSLRINDSYHFLQKTDGLLITGPTGTNVMDLRIALIQNEDEPATDRLHAPL